MRRRNRPKRRNSMKHVFWLEPGRIAGRCGPNLEPWNANELHAGGIGAVISVNDGELVHSEDFRVLGMRYSRYSMSDGAPPRFGDLELNVKQLPAAYEWIEACLEDGLSVMIHCRSGKDRTCLLMAYYLIRRYDHSPEEAIAHIKTVRNTAFSAVGWDRFALDVLSSCRAQIPA